MQYNKKSSTTFLVGIIAGFVAGVLLAPKSGKETRQDIADRAKRVAEKAQANLHAVQEELGDKLHQAEEQAKKLGKKISAEAKQSLEMAKKTQKQTLSVLQAIKQGQSKDEDLDIAIKNAQAALDSLKKYFQK